MTQRLSLEVYSAQKEEWIPLPSVNLGDRDGTLSANHERGRDVYLFGVDPIANQGYIKKSELGLDVAASDLRALSTTGFILVAALSHGESYELKIQTDSSPEPRTLRFTYLES